VIEFVLRQKSVLCALCSCYKYGELLLTTECFLCALKGKKISGSWSLWESLRKKRWSNAIFRRRHYKSGVTQCFCWSSSEMSAPVRNLPAICSCWPGCLESHRNMLSHAHVSYFGCFLLQGTTDNWERRIVSISFSDAKFQTCNIVYYSL